MLDSNEIQLYTNMINIIEVWKNNDLNRAEQIVQEINNLTLVESDILALQDILKINADFSDELTINEVWEYFINNINVIDSKEYKILSCTLIVNIKNQDKEATRITIDKILTATKNNIINKGEITSKIVSFLIKGALLLQDYDLLITIRQLYLQEGSL